MVLHDLKASERHILGVHSGTMHLFLFSVKKLHDSNSYFGFISSSDSVQFGTVTHVNFYLQN